MAEVRAYKVTSLQGVKPNSIVALKVPNENKFELWVTDINGMPFPLRTISESGGVIQSIVNTDGNITITGSNNLIINIAPSLLSVINSALQVGDNISDLNNDAGYITIETDPIFQASEASLFVAGDKVNLDNQSGINTGDETTSSIQTKRPLKTVNNESLEGVGNIQIDYNDLIGLPTLFSGDYNDLDNLPALITLHSQLTLDDGTNPHNTTKSDVGLGNVDNTSDLDKPISTATQNALNNKENTIVAGTTSQYYRGDKTFQTLDKVAVGLSNIDNTSDINKPVSTAQAAADANILASAKTYSDSKIVQTITDGDTIHAPSSDVIFDALSAKQATLVSGTNIKTIEGQSILGNGNIDLTKSDVGLSNVDNTSDASKPISTATQTALNNKVDKFIQITGITITTTGWTLVSGVYEYTYSNANITSNSIIDIVPDNSAYSIVSAAQLLPRVDSSNGSLKIYSNNVPSANFGISIIINKN